MSPLSLDRVQESTTTTGTGDIALGGASQPGLLTFSSQFTNGNLVSYVIVNQAVNTEWERGIGTFNSTPDTISRTYVLAGTSYPSATNFSAGTKSVLNPAPESTAAAPYASSYVYVPGDTTVEAGATWYALNLNTNSPPSSANANWTDIGGSGAGNVLSVFGRTGAVVASAADYSTFYGQLAVANIWSATQTISGNNQLYFSSGAAYPEIVFTGGGGSNYGYIGIAASRTWALGYSSTQTTLGTSVLSWNDSNEVSTKNNILDNGLGAATFVGNITLPGTLSGATNASPSLVLEAWTGTAAVYHYIYEGPSGNLNFLNSTNSTQITMDSLSDIILYAVQSGTASSSPYLGFEAWTGTGVIGNSLLTDSNGTFHLQNNSVSNLLNVTQTGAITTVKNTLDDGSGNVTIVGKTQLTGSYIREFYGASGNYSTVATNTWGGPIWGMDTAYTGGIGAANWVPTGVYGIAWQSNGSTHANASIAEGLYVYDNGTLEGGIGTAGVLGRSYATISTRRIKENIQTLTDTSLLDRLRPVEHEYKVGYGRTGKHYGFIAEEVATERLTMVGLDGEGNPHSVNYQEAIPLLVARVQELTDKIARLEEDR